jgi:hypothetical protein
MKILITDDDGTTLYEQNDPGFLHLPVIYDNKHSIACDEDDCPDPRCIERRAEADELLDRWTQNGQELGLVYFPIRHEDIDEFEKMPNFNAPLKVRLQSYSRNELLLSTGERMGYFLPSVNVYNDHQIMFSTGKREASLFPWSERWEERANAAAGKGAN